MNELANFWNIIVKSNTFNFAVLLLIFAFLFKKLNVSALVEKIKQDIINTINNAKAERENAKNKLYDAQKSIEHIEEEIKQRLDEASLRGEGIAKQIAANADEQVKLIEKNISRVINAEEKTLSAKITEKTLKASIELAKQHIKNTLVNNPELHNKFIDESIDNIDRV
ncbi:aTP synthase F0 B subunit [Fusobacterium sp. CAG:439]|nr:aTP synthase F0 B subunit [Fusobacterium sp. CAG:439]